MNTRRDAEDLRLQVRLREVSVQAQEKAKVTL
jgi:hypothetical protein